MKKSFFILTFLLIFFFGSSITLFADQTYQTVKTIDVAVGNITTPELYGPLVVAAFKKSTACPHNGAWAFVSVGTVNCIYKVQPNLIPITAQIFHDNTVGVGTFLQCVGFARGIAAAARRTLESRNAKDYLFGGTPSGWTRIYKTSFGAIQHPIKPGDLVLWNWGEWGHIAVVVSVQGSYAVTVAEGNGQCSGCLDMHTYSYANPFLLGWLTR